MTTNQSLTPVTGGKIPTPTQFVSQVSPRALSELFAKDPEELSDQDLDHIVCELRKQRETFAADEAAKAMKPKKPRAVSTSKAEVQQLSLEDLGL
jgi:hypothetical protein